MNKARVSLALIIVVLAQQASATDFHAGAELTVAERGDPLIAAVIGWSRPEPRAGYGWRSGGEFTVTLLEASSPETGRDYRRDGFRYWWGIENDHGARMRMRVGTIIAHESNGNHSEIVTDLFAGLGVQVQRRWRLELVLDTGQHYSLAASRTF